MPSLQGAILVLEDIGESVYKIDRCLAQLKHAGILAQLNGLIFGQFIDCETANTPSLQLKDVIEYYIHDLSIPVLGNFPYGHDTIKFTLPIGCNVQLDSRKGMLTLLEPGVKNE